MKKGKNKGGRPTIYNKKIAEEICAKVSSTTLGLKRLCKENPQLPHADTIYEWRFKYPEFSGQYAAAKMKQAELLAEEILDISDDDSQDTIITDKGPSFNSEYVQRSRLRIDTRKWIACKLIPKVYGDKIENQTTVTIKEEFANTVEDRIKKYVKPA